MRLFLLAGGVGCVLAITNGSAVHASNLKVAAAANLQIVLSKALIPEFQRMTGDTVTATYGATKLLATQLQNGAPEDLFMSADSATPLMLAKDQILVPSTVHPYAVGKLVIWSRRDMAHHPRSIQDLASPLYAKIAIANPRLAPYGLAAQQAIAAAGLTSKVASRLVTAENIGQCLAYARSGNADVALTALSLVINDHADPYIVVPESLHAPIIQSLGIVKGASDTAVAARFAAFLTGPGAAPIWKRYGYASFHAAKVPK